MGSSQGVFELSWGCLQPFQTQKSCLKAESVVCSVPGSGLSRTEITLGSAEPQTRAPRIRKGFTFTSFSCMIHLLHFCWQEKIKNTECASLAIVSSSASFPIRSAPHDQSSPLQDVAAKQGMCVSSLLPYAHFLCFKS